MSNELFLDFSFPNKNKLNLDEFLKKIEKEFEKINENYSIEFKFKNDKIIIKTKITQPLLIKIDNKNERIIITDDHNKIYKNENQIYYNQIFHDLEKNENIYGFNLYNVIKNDKDNKNSQNETENIEENTKGEIVYYSKELNFKIMRERISNDLILVDPNETYIIDFKDSKNINILENFNDIFIPKETISELNNAKNVIKEKFIQYFENIKRELKNPIVLFSGGVDSSSIALMLKKIGFKPLLISLGVKGMQNKDLEISKKVAKFLNLKIIEILVELDEIENALKETIKIIGSKNTTKIEVGLVGYLLLKYIKDKLKIKNAEIFTGLGSEEIFAGYERHKSDQFLECISGLLNIYHKDVYRDYNLVKHFGFKPMIPFLDYELVKEALKIDDFKIYKGYKKYIFRVVAKELGLDDFAFRKKLAAQYGSNISKSLEKITKKHGFKYKKDYINYYINHK